MRHRGHKGLELLFVLGSILNQVESWVVKGEGRTGGLAFADLSLFM